MVKTHGGLQPVNSRSPADRDVGGELVDLPLEGQALAVPVQEVQAFIVGVHGVAEAVSSPLQPNDRLKSNKTDEVL